MYQLYFHRTQSLIFDFFVVPTVQITNILNLQLHKSDKSSKFSHLRNLNQQMIFELDK